MPARVTAIGLVVLLFTGCATVPTGPSVMVLPGTGKSFEQFQADDAVCRSWALQQAGTQPGTAATRDTLTGAAVGAVVGAGLGAAIGAA
ncbi:MAG: glycine zipper family protein, partial [Candidatus Rokubacteria bacterium]|nr:glycine zipper family protein [Candidatus Rokubacteria bacterium]